METIQHISMGGRQNANPQEIILLQADINYTNVLFSNGRKLVVATTLKELEKRFSTCTDFFRTHKSYLININYINSYNIAGEDEFVQMKNGYRATISRRKKKAFIERISI
jgi:DNA-binding LytR/AlgR family response regulator